MDGYVDSGEQYIKTTTNVKITVRELYELVNIKGMSDAKIARMYGLSAKTIRNYRRKCQFSSTFKTGRMDLPLSKVITSVRDGLNYDELAEKFNTTKTSVKAFCARHGISPGNSDVWPISRQDMIDLVVMEMTNTEIAKKYNVKVEDVENLQIKYEVDSFLGIKTYSKYGNGDRREVDPFDGMTLSQKASVYFGSRFSYDDRVGYMLDGRHINAIKMYHMVKHYEKRSSRQQLLAMIEE